MTEYYVERGYVECGYFENDCGSTEAEHIKVFGFSRKKVILPTEDDPLDEVKRDYARKAYRKAFRFPDQIVT